MKSFEELALQMPLEVYVLAGSFIEEVIAPIPASLVVIVAGTLAKAQGQPLLFIFLLALLGSFGKTLGGWVLYTLGDKGEHFIIDKFGKTLGINHKGIEKISTRLNKGWQDNVYIFLARLLPFIPTAPVSVVCGILKINVKNYLIASFVGVCLRNLFFLYLGYFGLVSYKTLRHDIGSAETIIKIIVVGIVGVFLVWFVYKKITRWEKKE